MAEARDEERVPEGDFVDVVAFMEDFWERCLGYMGADFRCLPLHKVVIIYSEVVVC